MKESLYTRAVIWVNTILNGWGEPTRTLVPWRQEFGHPTRNECMDWFVQIILNHIDSRMILPRYGNSYIEPNDIMKYPYLAGIKTCEILIKDTKMVSKKRQHQSNTGRVGNPERYQGKVSQLSIYMHQALLLLHFKIRFVWQVHHGRFNTNWFIFETKKIATYHNLVAGNPRNSWLIRQNSVLNHHSTWLLLPLLSS